MFSEWDRKTDTMYVSSITQPDGSGVDKFNYVDETLKITGASAAAMNRAAKEGPLQVSNFETALNNPADVKAISVQVQTPEATHNFPTMTVNADGTMSESSQGALNNTTVTNANAPEIVEPFIHELDATTGVLQQAYRTYEQ